MLQCLTGVDRRGRAPKVNGSVKTSFNFSFLLFTLLVKGRKWWSDDKNGACLEKQKPFSCKHKPPCFSGWWKTHFSADWTCKRSSVFPFASVNRDLPALPEYISTEEDLFKTAKVYVTIGKSLAWIINTSAKRVLNSLYDHNMSNKCFKASWCMYLMHEPMSEKSIFDRGRCAGETLAQRNGDDVHHLKP